MNITPNTIDRIVAGVLNQLGAGGDGAQRESTTETRRYGGASTTSVSQEATPTADRDATSIKANVITADVLLDALTNEPRIVVSERAIVTPAAWDAAKERRIEIVRGGSGLAAHLKCAAKPEPVTATPLLVIVRNTDAVDRLWDDLNSAWQRELLGCPDDAASLAISAICRGETLTVAVLAEQTHRAACLANRNERIKAVVARDAGDVRAIKKQLRANVWCIDPTGCSWFELRNIFTAISNISDN